MAIDTEKNNYVVHGTITGLQGEEIEDAEVIVWWQRIRDRHQLATGKTSTEGEYRIAYQLPDETPGKPLIVVEARSRHLESPLESPITPAQPDLKIDLAVTLCVTICETISTDKLV